MAWAQGYTATWLQVRQSFMCGRFPHIVLLAHWQRMQLLNMSSFGGAHVRVSKTCPVKSNCITPVAFTHQREVGWSKIFSGIFVSLSQDKVGQTCLTLAKETRWTNG